MKVRPAGIFELGAIEDLHRRAGESFSAAPPTAHLWSLLSSTLSALLPLVQETLLFVAEDGKQMAGFVQASGRPSGTPLAMATSLQVLNLVVEPEHDLDEVAAALLEHLLEQAMGRGIHRLFVRVPVEAPAIPAFRRQGFRQYATEDVLYADRPRPLGDASGLGVRPARGRDLRLLYHLYRKVTPNGVAQMEASSYREWRRLRGEPIWRLGQEGGQQFVVDRVEIAGWAAVQKSSTSRPHTLSFLVAPEPSLPGELADHVLGLLGDPPGPAWTSLRHYDAHMIDALRGRGFTTLLTQSLMVKELAVRVPLRRTALVPSFS